MPINDDRKRALHASMYMEDHEQAEIKRLKAENKQLKEALADFCRAAEAVKGLVDGN